MGLNPNTAIRGTGNAPIKKVGQTASNQNGANTSAKVQGRSTRELSAK